jgi:hypothetical protein
MSQPQQAHLDAVKYILRYVKKTSDFGLFYQSTIVLTVQGFTDADWASCPETCRSISGYCFTMAGSTLTWQSKRQLTVAKSSTESEYVSLSTGTSKAVWLGRLLAELGLADPQSSTLPLGFTSRQIQHDLQLALPVFCNNQFATKIAKNPMFHARTKHIEVVVH